MEIESFTAESRERCSLLSSELRYLPLQLLPRATYPPEQLEAGLKWQADFSKTLESPPLISVVVIGEGLNELPILFESLSVQSYPHFEVVVATGKEFQSEARSLFEQFGFPGRLICSDESSESFREALSLAKSSHALLLRNTKFLHPQALFIFAKELIARSPDFIYSNEVLVSAAGDTTREYHRRSEADRFSLLSRNPFGQALLVSSKIAQIVANEESLPSSLDALFWSLGALVAPTPGKISFLPLGLVISCERTHREEIIDNDCLDVVRRYAVRIGLELEDVTLLEDEDSLAIKPQPVLPIAAANALAQVIIPFRDSVELTSNCLKTLAQQTIANKLEVTLVDNGSSEESLSAIGELLNELKLNGDIFSDDGNFNFARLNNFGASQSKAPYLLFLNNDVELTEPAAIEELLRWCAVPQVGVVGGILNYPDGAPQSAGINFAPTRPLNVHLKELYMDVVREANAVTFAMAMVSREAFDKVCGLDELECPNGFGDALVCHRLRELGFRTLFIPFAVAIHHESKSRASMPEELELLELYRAGVPISDLFADFGAKDQPTRVSFNEIEQPPVLRLANRVVQSPRWHAVADRVARRVLKFDRARRTAQ